MPDMEELLIDIISPSEWLYFLRIALACLCGGIIGLEREIRSKTAGVRTHIMVALASSLMMIVSKYGFFDIIVYDSISLDASRIAASVVSAVGFLGAGAIFMKGENTIGLTTSAGLWTTVGIGIAIGAGLYVTGILATALVLVMQFLLHIRFAGHGGAPVAAKAVIITNNADYTIKELYKAFREADVLVRSIHLSFSGGNTELTVLINFSKKDSIDSEVAKLSRFGKLESLELISGS